MSDMVERVAIAIEKEGREKLAVRMSDKKAMELARVAIEAMREPTKEQLALYDDSLNARATWALWINEALK